MSIKLEQYKIFHEAATTLSFSLASRNLFITQSAVSQAIKAMEKEMHTKLFNRNAKGVTLTKEGEILHTYITHALELIQTAEHKISNMQELKDGNLIIGAGDTISANYLMPYLETFHRTYPKVKITVINRTSLEMLPLIETNAIDLGFLNLPIEREEIEVVPCLEVHDIFVASKHSPISPTPYQKADIAEMPLILLEKNSNSRHFIEEAFAKDHIRLHPQLEIGAHHLLLEFAKIDLGVSCVIKEFSQEYLQRNDIQELILQDPLPARSIGYAYLKKSTLSAPAVKFIEILTHS